MKNITPSDALAARGEILVLVDDDNILAPDYLASLAGTLGVDPALLP